MILDLENLNPGYEFEMEGGGKITLRVCAGDDYRAIRKQCIKKKVEYKNNGRFVVEEPNEDLQNELIWDFCIVDWSNLFDRNNTPIPCTKENKCLLMGKSIKFAKFVTDKLEEISELDKEIKETEIKN